MSRLREALQSAAAECDQLRQAPPRDAIFAMDESSGGGTAAPVAARLRSLTLRT